MIRVTTILWQAIRGDLALAPGTASGRCHVLSAGPRCTSQTLGGMGGRLSGENAAKKNEAAGKRMLSLYII